MAKRRKVLMGGKREKRALHISYAGRNKTSGGGEKWCVKCMTKGKERLVRNNYSQKKEEEEAPE